jgi:hypothetical protein
MKKLALAAIVVLGFSTTAMAIEIAISTQANWWTQAAADREMQEIVDNVTAVPVLRFDASEHGALADWVETNTGDGDADLLILCGQCPDTIYAAGNTQPDGSLAELFVDDGNCIVNTGDWIFYMVNGAGTNGTAALPNIMDIPNMDMWDDNTPVTVTADGQLYTPSLVDFQTDRGIHLDLLENDWHAELILALAADGNRADPCILRNSATGGRIGIFFQTANQDDDPRGEVMSEWINNWYLQVIADPALAVNVSPEDEAVDVPRDVTLTWSPGQSAVTHDVYLGTVFEDVNDASRADPRDVLVSEGQSEASYQPAEMLEFGTTYYWRIDEVNGAPDNTIFKGDVWSFTTEPFAYAIAGVMATSNGVSDAENGPERLVDGSGLDADSLHSVESDDMWLATPSGADPLTVSFEFDRVYKMHEMLVWNYNVEFEPLLGFGVKNVTVEYSENGTDWTVLGDVELAQATAQAGYAANTTVDLQGVAAQYVRLTVNGGFGMTGQYGLSEVRFMYIPAHAREPEPADGATDVSVDSALVWRAGRDAATHEVYFGTDAAALELAGTPSEASYDPGALDLDVTYYWKVDEVSDATWAGALWSFATQPYLVVDDFESYDDDENAIFDTWMDGFVNETGSTVGYFEAPFAETSIVHGGGQSMPMQFDNVGGLATSEAELSLGGQDWTEHGIRSLSLHFLGGSGNSGQLYVKINDTKVAYDGDAADIGRASWQAWNIDLSAVGANLQNVTLLTIGVEGAGAQGMIYIDDIRLYPQAPEYITPAEPDSANLVAYYALDGDATDGSGYGIDGTAEGNPGYGPGVAGQAATFDGVGDWLDFGNPAHWPSGTAARTMTGWAMSSSVESGWRWIAAYGTGATNQAMFIGMNGASLYGGGYGNDVYVDNFWVVDEWYHIGLTYDGTTARLYGNGIEVAASVKTGWNLVPNRAHIGRQVNNASEFWAGSVDEVRIYDVALSAEEMAWVAGRTLPVHKPF